MDDVARPRLSKAKPRPPLPERCAPVLPGFFGVHTGARKLTAYCYYRSDSRSRVIARSMAMGIRSLGDEAVECNMERFTRHRCPGDVAVYYGFKGTGKEVFADYLAAGKHVIFVDLGYWGRRWGLKRFMEYHRFSVDSRHPSRIVMQKAMPEDRLAMLRRGIRTGAADNISKDTDLTVKPWRKRGKFVLLAGMQPKASDSYGLGYMDWERRALDSIRAATDRPVIYRPKPKDERQAPLPGTVLSDRSEKLSEVFARCWAVVTHHSNVAADAVIEGVPAFGFDGIWLPMGKGAIGEIEQPYRPDASVREQWLRNACYFQYRVDEMQAGLPWLNFREMGLLDG